VRVALAPVGPLGIGRVGCERPSPVGPQAENNFEQNKEVVIVVVEAIKFVGA
tara:strand:- start:398 stop:553 length:156 start_codon:yes stop_codon:yes gene_type:complete